MISPTPAWIRPGGWVLNGHQARGIRHTNEFTCISRRKGENVHALSQLSMSMHGNHGKQPFGWRRLLPKVLASLFLIGSVMFPSPRSARAGTSHLRQGAAVERQHVEEHPPFLTIKGLRRASGRILFFVGDSRQGKDAIYACIYLTYKEMRY